MAKILFLHGLEAKPGGRKPTYLISRGHEVLNPALPDHDFPESVTIAQSEFDTHSPDLVVGSSRGGAVALALRTGSTPVLVLAPAWKFYSLAPACTGPLCILHSANDELIPIEHSRELLQILPQNSVQLVEVGEDHGMFDSAALSAMDTAIAQLTKSP